MNDVELVPKAGRQNYWENKRLRDLKFELPIFSAADCALVSRSLSERVHHAPVVMSTPHDPVFKEPCCHYLNVHK